MYTILHVFLFVLINCARSENEDDVVMLPIWDTHNRNISEVPLNFSAFGQNINLLLKRNNRLLAPSFLVWRHTGEETEKVPELSEPATCYYLYSDSNISAAISFCQSRAVHGMIFLENSTLEISPLGADKSLRYNNGMDKRSHNYSVEPHIVKRAHIPETLSSLIFKRDVSISNEIFPHLERPSKNPVLTIELAVFFDEIAYKTFAPLFNYKEGKIRDMLLAYVNGIQALFHHPSLGTRIDIALVRLDLLRKQPIDLPHFGGERNKLLNSFCSFSSSRNPKSDDDPNHWDISLYVSGLDFYAPENGQKNSVTMGLASVGGACVEQYNCVIAEFGVTNRFGKPYPSAGFTSVYIAAHEIGHNLGMHHDSLSNVCPKDGYIMSPSRGTQGETIWSECSRSVVRNLPSTMPCLLDTPYHKKDKSLTHEKYLNLPGRKWDAKKQCEVLLRDQDAVPQNLPRACEALQCKSPHRSGFYFAGPALEGTLCGPSKECHGGVCIPTHSIPSSTPETPIDLWTDWEAGPCKSGCIQNSLGAFQKRRTCLQPSSSSNSGLSCEGPSYQVDLCQDEGLCRKDRRTAEEFATTMCGLFSENLTHLDPDGTGLQAPHETERPWMACAIFCLRKDISSYYTPRIELNDLGLDPYFPDGTWCHRENQQDFFCRQHHCLPEGFQLTKILGLEEEGGVSGLGVQNAAPKEQRLPEQVVRYLSLGSDGRPLLTTLMPDVGSRPSEDDWTDRDYIELPQALGRPFRGKESASASLHFM